MDTRSFSRSIPRSTRIALGGSLLIHSLLLAPVALPWLSGEAAPAPGVVPDPGVMAVTFVDPAEAPPEPPVERTELVSSRAARAAQPEAPEELPPGEAFRRGETSLPAMPRPPGAARVAAGEEASRRRESDEPADGDEDQGDRRDESRPRLEGAERMPDPLALPLGPIAPGAARRMAAEGEAGNRLPSPGVDQRLTRAAAGSSFRLNTMEWEWAPYMERLKRRVEEHVAPPMAFYYGTAAWATQVRFRIEPDGRLSKIELLDHRGVGNLQYVALDAVQGAADYEPLPPGFPESYLEVTGNFYFNTFPGR